MKNRRLAALDEIQQRIMRRVKPLLDRERILDIDRDPVPECQFVVKVRAQGQVPLRQIPHKKRPPGFENPYHFVEPFAAPVHVVVTGACVVDVGGIFFPQVERGICESEINAFWLKRAHNLNAIGLKKLAEVRV